MICCCSQNLDENNHHFDKLETPRQKKVKILVLGPSDAGKTTIIKQLKLLNDMYDEEDSKNMTNYIRDSVLSSMKTLCDQSLILKEHYNLETGVHRSVEYLRDEILSLPSSSNLLNTNFAYKIKELWNDDGIQNTLKQRHRFQIDDNIHYFFNKIEQISAQNYLPDFDDYVRIRRRSIGYSPTKFMKYVDTYGESHGEYHFEVPDVGGTKSERRKWWTPKLLLDDNLKAIIFVVPLSDYNITLYEDNETNRLKDSIELFKNIMIKGNFFKDKTIMLFFNKYDLFVEKIKEIPITVCFNDFDESQSDPNNVDDVMKFVAGEFLSVFHDNDINLSKPLRILRTTAIDTENIRDTFDKILPDIVAKNVATFEIDKD